MAEDKARDRVPSCDSARERNAGFRPQGPDVARMDFFNGLLGMFPVVVVSEFIGKAESPEGIWIVVDPEHSPNGAATSVRAGYASLSDDYFSKFASVRLMLTCGSNSDVVRCEIK